MKVLLKYTNQVDNEPEESGTVIYKHHGKTDGPQRYGLAQSAVLLIGKTFDQGVKLAVSNLKNSGYSAEEGTVTAVTLNGQKIEIPTDDTVIEKHLTVGDTITITNTLSKQAVHIDNTTNYIYVDTITYRIQGVFIADQDV